MAGKKNPISLYLSEALQKRLARIARARDISRSKLCEQLLEDAVEQEEMMVKVTADPVVSHAFAAAVSRPEVMSALLRSLRADLTDEQLQLFEERLTGVPVKKGVKRGA